MKKKLQLVVVIAALVVNAPNALSQSASTGGSAGGPGSDGGGTSASAGGSAGYIIYNNVPSYPDIQASPKVRLEDFRTLYHYGIITGESICKVQMILEKEQKEDSKKMLDYLVKEQHIDCGRS